MKIDYEKLDAYLKQNKRLLEAMSDKDYNDHINAILEEFHYDEEEEA